MKNKNVGKITIVVGGAYGSEGKGLFIGELSKEKHFDYAVRTGAINAGHTVFYKGKQYKMQQIPVSWVDHDTKLIIGGGAYIHLETLDREIKMINEATGIDNSKRLYIDFKAGVHLDEHMQKEGDMKLHERMGSTGKGCMAATIDKMERRMNYRLFSKRYVGYNFVDTSKMLNDAYDDGAQILLEGTQGTLLDFHFADYPFVTARQTIAASWMSEAGLSPNLNTEIIMVCRTYPIRVAGNSGPMGKEISWPTLARRMNVRLRSHGMSPIISENTLETYEEAIRKTAVSLGLPDANVEEWDSIKRMINSASLTRLHQETFAGLHPIVMDEISKLFELTTVTKKLRRIAELDIDELKHAVRLNRPDYIVMMFVNYVFPESSNAKDIDSLQRIDTQGEILGYIKSLEKETHVPIKYINTNAESVIKIS